MKKLLFFLISITLSCPACAEELKIGFATVLSGDLAIAGKNVETTVQTYQKHYLRHPIKFIFEDARLSSTDGLRAYQKLINLDKVDLILAACTSNGTMAAKALIHSSKTPTFSISTGGKNIDNAGPYLFRIGNSDTLNGTQQADYFLQKGITRVVLLTEETEYTQDIAEAFRGQFLKSGGKILSDQNFLPGTTDFRSEITKFAALKPQAVFMPTQTGTALGVFLKQWNAQTGGERPEIYTTFVAAPNPDAHETAGDLIYGVNYMNPEYDEKGTGYQKFLKLYREDHGEDPPVPFHAAGTVDALNHIQNYLDSKKNFSAEAFREYLLTDVGNYCGLMGCYTFDEKGNTALGFQIAQITEK